MPYSASHSSALLLPPVGRTSLIRPRLPRVPLLDGQAEAAVALAIVLIRLLRHLHIAIEVDRSANDARVPSARVHLQGHPNRLPRTPVLAIHHRHVLLGPLRLGRGKLQHLSVLLKPFYIIQYKLYTLFNEDKLLNL